MESERYSKDGADMQAWWDSLSEILKILYCIAIPATLVMLLQLLLAMAGGQHDTGVEFSDTSGIEDLDLHPDFDWDAPERPDFVADGSNPSDFATLKLLSLQTVVIFLAVFSWVSIICISSGMKYPVSLFIGVDCGFCMMLLVAKMVQMSARLAENGTLNLKNAIGETATVYVTIPARQDGMGKITMQLQGRFCELDAVSSTESGIPSGTQVLVVDVVNDTLVVEPGR